MRADDDDLAGAGSARELHLEVVAGAFQHLVALTRHPVSFVTQHLRDVLGGTGEVVVFVDVPLADGPGQHRHVGAQLRGEAAFLAAQRGKGAPITFARHPDHHDPPEEKKHQDRAEQHQQPDRLPWTSIAHATHGDLQRAPRPSPEPPPGAGGPLCGSACARRIMG